MKKAQYQFIPARAKPHKISFYSADGKRTAKFFESQFDALAFQAKINENENELNLPDNLDFPISERIIFAQIKTECQRQNATLADALACLKEYLPKFKHTDVVGRPWQAATEAYFVDLQRRGARASSVRFYKSQIGLFERRENPRDIAEITTEHAERYLAGISSPEHAKRALRAFYSYCIARKWVAVNPFARAKTPRKLKEHKNAEILSVEQARQFLEALPLQWQPVAAIMAFAGVRPAEIISMDGSPILKIADVDFDARKITIRAEVSKVRRARILADLPANLWAWLAPLKNRPTTQTVAPASYDVWRRAKTKCGVELPKDVLRHSFASYGYHYLGAERTVEILGHVGGFGVFAKHYKGLADAANSEKYFAIYPQKKAGRPAV